jgi:hypothetical protein
MATTAIAPLQFVWECKWSRVRAPLTTDVDRWMCAHEGAPRAIAEETCRACPHWEYAYDTAVDDHLAMPKLSVPGRRGLLQGVILLNAAVFFVIGFVPLTSLFAIPFAVTMWLGAAALTGFAFFGPIPEG